MTRLFFLLPPKCPERQPLHFQHQHTGAQSLSFWNSLTLKAGACLSFNLFQNFIGISILSDAFLEIRVKANHILLQLSETLFLTWNPRKSLYMPNSVSQKQKYNKNKTFIKIHLSNNIQSLNSLVCYTVFTHRPSVLKMHRDNVNLTCTVKKE